MEPAKVRFRLDEHVTHAIARALKRRGVDVVTATETGTVGLPDDQVLARCYTEGRLLITNDNDYLRLHNQGIPHAGIVFFAFGARSIGEMVAFLMLVVDVYSPDEIANRVEFA
jgi:predicted nuclease of predicted toxin-antitoxin system